MKFREQLIERLAKIGVDLRLTLRRKSSPWIELQPKTPEELDSVISLVKMTIAPMQPKVTKNGDKVFEAVQTRGR